MTSESASYVRDFNLLLALYPLPQFLAARGFTNFVLLVDEDSDISLPLICHQLRLCAIQSLYL